MNYFTLFIILWVSIGWTRLYFEYKDQKRKAGRHGLQFDWLPVLLAAIWPFFRRY